MAVSKWTKFEGKFSIRFWCGNKCVVIRCGNKCGRTFGVVLKIHKTQNDPLTTDTRVEHKTEAKSGELNGSNGLNGSKKDGILICPIYTWNKRLTVIQKMS